MKLFSWVPNFLTICNLMCGCAAILAALEGQYTLVFWLVCVAAIFDFADGMAARLLRAYSPMGKELDSLADMVSFGVVPATVMFAMMTTEGLGIWAYTAYAVAAFSALRLAKFNIDTRQSDSFIGMPTPAGALLIASFATFGTGQSAVLYLVVVAMVSALLVAPIPMFSFKFKSYGIKENVVRYAFAAFAVIMIGWFRMAAPAQIIVCYVLLSSALAVGKGCCKRLK